MVVLISFLPIDSNNQLLYSRCKLNVNNLGFSLLEKAYAKLYGCYALIKDLTLEQW